MAQYACAACSTAVSQDDDVCPACGSQVFTSTPSPRSAPQRRTSGLDEHGQPFSASMNQARRATRDVCELLGIVKGVLFDGVFSDDEARALARWMETHPDAHADWAVRTVWERLNRAMVDGVIDDGERADLVATMDALVGGTMTTVTGTDAATSLPLDDPLPVVEWTGHLYIFTGKFAYGTREACEREVEQRGGACTGSITRRTTYLVIGTFGSRDWATTSYGRKIQAAVDLRTRGTPLRIVCEDHWAAAL